jgi:E3 ubiquitin-protein ligase MYCBP2
MRLRYEGKENADEITDTASLFFGKPAEFAMHRYNYYTCFRCAEPYFGGERDCGAEAGAQDGFDPSELVCPACSAGGAAEVCAKHGTDFLEFKCRWCCSTAVWFCFGTTHFCEPCHNDHELTSQPSVEQLKAQGRLPSCPCGPSLKALPAGTPCPLGVDHPPTGEEFALGCGICRNVSTF